MLNTVTYSYNKSNDVYTFRGYFGYGLSREIEKRISRSRTTALLNKIDVYEISIHSFFLFELHHLLKTIMRDTDIYVYSDVGYPTIESTIDIIEEIHRSHNTNNEKLDLNIVKQLFKYDIKDYQEAAFTEYIKIKMSVYKRGYLLDAGTGTGKTFMSLALAEALKCDVVVIIAPKVIAEKVWIDGICWNSETKESNESVYKNPYKVYTTISGIKHYNLSTVYTGHKYIVASYETIPLLMNILSEIKMLKVGVIIDEWHNFSDKEANRTVDLVKFIQALDNNDVIPMSGTPLKAAAKELSTLYSIIDTRYDKNIEHRFNVIYKNPTDYLKSMMPMRYSDYSVKISKEALKLAPVINISLDITLPNGNDYTLVEIRKKLTQYVKLRTEELNNNFDLYEKRYYDLYNKAKTKLLKDNKISAGALAAYEEDVKSIKKYYNQRTLMMYGNLLKRVNSFEKNIILPALDTKLEKSDFTEAKSIVKYLMYKVRGDALANVVLKERIRCYSDIARNIDYENILSSSKNKVMLFSKFIEVCDTANNTINRKTKFKSVPAYGDYLNNLSSTIDKFKKDDKIKAISTTYNALGTGVPFTEANTIIILDTPYRAYIYDQAIARAHRGGQKEQVYVYHPILKTAELPNIVDRGFDIIKFYMEAVEEITGYKFDFDLTMSTEAKNIITGTLTQPVLAHPYAVELWDSLLSIEEHRNIRIEKKYNTMLEILRYW